MANLPETPQWEDGIYQIEVSDPVLGGPDGISNRQAKQLAKRTSYLKQQVENGGKDLADHIAEPNPHTQYAPKESPALTGTPTAPTAIKTDNSTKLATTGYVKNVVADYAPLASPGLTGKPTAPTAAQASNDTQLATTAFVKAALAALVASSPEALDTLNELAAALGNDPNFATTMTNALAGKQPLDTTLTNLSGKSISGLLEYLGLGEGSALPVGVPVPWPLPNPPLGWLKYNGAQFDKNIYPRLGAIYPGGVLPDLRGEFIRGWDDGRGVNASRALLSAEADMNQSHRHLFESSMDGGTTWGNANPYIDFNSGNSVSHTPNNIFVQVLRAQIGGAGSGWEGVNSSGVRNQVSGGNESRPRNIAFNYIVRAA